MPFRYFTNYVIPPNCVHAIKQLTKVDDGYKITCVICGLETKPSLR
jgi:hypothetical protein